MKKFKRLKKGFISLLVVSLVMATLMNISMVDIFAISTTSEVEVVKVEPEVKEVQIEKKKELYVDVTPVVAKYEEIKEEVPDTVKSEPLTIADGKNVSEKIKIACEIYGVSYDLAMGIARLETGHFKSNAFKNKNNVGGMMWKGKVMSFDSLDEGVDRYVKNLHKNYISCGLNTPEKMAKKYCPGSSTWAGKVRSLM